MLIATFAPTTGWSGKSITYEGEQFVLEEHGPITAEDVLEYDRQGQLIWAYETLPGWVREVASVRSPQQEPASASARPQAQPPRRGRKIILAVVGSVVGLLVVLAIIGALMPSDSGPETAPSAKYDKSPTYAPGEANDPDAVAAGETQPEAAETADATETDPPEPVADKPTSYKGSGNRIVKIKKPSGEKDEAVIVTISHNGSSNFAVWSLDKKLRQDQLLVNVIGDYEGTVPLDFEEGQQTTRMQVEADGSWRMTIKPVPSVRRFSSKIKGKGDDVVFFEGGAKIATIKHSGSSNFAVWYYGSDYSDLLVNDIGKYSGQSPLPGEAVLVVTADGNWSIFAR